MSITHSPEESERAEQLSLGPYKAVVGQPDIVQASHWLGDKKNCLLKQRMSDARMSILHVVKGLRFRCLSIPSHPVRQMFNALIKEPLGKKPSVDAHSLKPSAALTLHTSTLVKPLPAYFPPRSSLPPEIRLRWKPPGSGERSKRHAYHALTIGYNQAL